MAPALLSDNDTRRRTCTFVDERVAPAAQDVDASQTFPRTLYREAVDLGLLSLALPAEHGGRGAPYLHFLSCLQELARGSTALASSVLLGEMLASALARWGSDAHRTRYLDPLLRGEIIGSFAVTEPDAGSDLAAVASRARREGEAYALSGTKTFINAATVADFALVLASTEPAEAHRGLSFFLVDRDASGFTVGDAIDLMGHRGLGVAPLHFEDVRIPAGARLGDEGEGFKIAMAALDRGRVAVAALALGLARAALEEAVAYARRRQQFGRPIGAFQAIRFKLADMATELEAAQHLVRHAATRLDEGARASREAAMAKLFASEAANRIVDEALQIHGGHGYTRGSAVERLYRDVRVTRIYEGTNEIQRLLIGRDLLESDT